MLQLNPQAEAELTWNEFRKFVRGQLRGLQTLAQISVRTEDSEWGKKLREQWAIAERKKPDTS
jgi:hypothetical protein